MIHAQHRNTALLVAGCFFMENLDGTIVSTAAPRMGASLGVAPTAISLVITAYLLTLAVLIPLSGWLTARFGARRVFLTAITVFTLASLACAAATDLGVLVAMRVLQGAGGAMMVPVGRLIVVAKAEKPDLPRVMAYITWPGLIAPVIAPLIGGLITTYANWRWMFLINIPLGVVAFAVAWRLIEAAPAAQTPPRLDWLGVALTSTGLGALTWTAHLLSETSAGTGPVLVTGAAAVLLLGAAVWHLLRSDNPLVDLSTLKVKTFRASASGGSLFWIAVGAVPFLLPLLFQEALGWSAVKSGVVVLFVFIGNIGIKPATTPLLKRYGFRPLLLAAGFGLGASMVASAFIDAATPLAVIALIALISGVARSLGLTAYSTIAFSDIPGERLRHANTLLATAQQMGAGLGVAAATVALRAGGPIGDWLPGRTTATTAYGVAFCLLALVCVGTVAGALRLHPTAGDAVRGPAPASDQGPAPARTEGNSRAAR
ncbi:DHA2 family efflux MFS transporter permease subunit [Streptomyces varsoviensis]|uniref:MFS transporter n=1 Tax=Streptomyces varsoviensis TaxID=67373 RepID=A0ABR5J270_9ACTN|nr:DHA2 family efflux MFS transporter permease subunit [Streptomyces varsoviensis]KOG87505.1 MFS transporter [Streptomyces varsoviensis]